jgi:hypothetical protein
MTDTLQPLVPAEVDVQPAKPRRKAIAAKARFEVFKRDKFTCQYCGAHPPGVLLHLDHITAVANGGTNDQHNLITSCEPCNLGKGARPLGEAKPSLKAQAEVAKERERQLLGYQKLIAAKRERLEVEIDRVQDVFAIFYPGLQFTPRFRISVRVFIEKLGVDDVCGAMERACCKCRGQSNATKYFCGICWSKVREAES